MHDDVIKWKYFPRYWPFVRGIHRSPVNSPHKGQWRGALMFTLIWARINVWVNNRKAGDLRRNRVHYDVIVMAAYGPRIKLWHVVLDYETRVQICGLVMNQCQYIYDIPDGRDTLSYSHTKIINFKQPHSNLYKKLQYFSQWIFCKSQCNHNA